MLAATQLFLTTAPTWRLLEVALSLGCVAAALFFVTRLLRQRHFSSGGRRMKLVERLVLEPRRSLHLVEVDGEVLLMATSERGVELLTHKASEILPQETPPEGLP